MEDDRGYWTWLAEPMIEEGRDRLKFHENDADCVPLDRLALDRIVGAVDAYFGAIYDNSIR